MFGFFNTREIATAIWVTIFAIWALFISGDVRRSVKDLLKNFFSKKIFVLWIIMIAYIALAVLVMQHVGFWYVSLSKDTILWTLGPAFASFLNITKATQSSSYLKDAILDNLKLVAILEYLVNLYTFSLTIELLLMPFISFVVALKVYAESRPEYNQVNKMLQIILVVFGLFFLAFTARKIVLNTHSFLSLDNMRNFLLPLVLSLALLPYIYLMALFMQYEMLFVRIDIAIKDADLVKYAKMKLILHCNIKLTSLIKVSRNIGYPKVNNKEDVSKWFISKIKT